MKFKNEGEKRLVRIGTSEKAEWISVNHLEEVDLPEEVGKYHGFKLVAFESDIHGTKVETKVSVPEKDNQNDSVPEKDNQNDSVQEYTSDDLFYKELTKIKGIGKKTAKDIMEWGTKEKLIEVVKEREHLPFRDDVSLMLKKKFLKRGGS